jgi:hypothetical protein
MTEHEIIVHALGAILVVGAPIAYRWMRVDGLIATLSFMAGISVIVTGHC